MEFYERRKVACKFTKSKATFPHYILLNTNINFCCLTSCRCDLRVVQEFIEEKLERTMQDLKLVLVTHMHPDHAGGAHLYQERLASQLLLLIR